MVALACGVRMAEHPGVKLKVIPARLSVLLIKELGLDSLRDELVQSIIARTQKK